MERLKAGVDDPYDAIEASIHVGRYALALPYAAGRRVLDAACGEGYGSWLLADAGAAEVVGVDISSEAIGKARTTFRQDRLRFETGAGEALAELLPAGHFDLVVSIETIEHVVDPEAFLNALRRVATPDAVFVLTCPNDHWYYGDAEGNPHHLRRFTLDEFKALTTRILGDQVRWLLGSATLGFAAVAIDQEKSADTALPQFTHVAPSRRMLRVPSGGAGPAPTNASYFIGVWNAPDTNDGAGAYHALSMDEYSRMMWTAASPAQFADLQAEAATLRTQQDDLASDIAALRAERDGLSANLAATQAERDAKAAEAAVERREREIVGVQAAALRRENEIVSSQLLELRAALDAAQHQAAGLQEMLAGTTSRAEAAESALSWHAARVRELDEALAWHVARVTNLDEALAWHIARIQNLEAEPPGRLVRRALGRTLRASPPLARLAARLRRRRAGS